MFLVLFVFRVFRVFGTKGDVEEEDDSDDSAQAVKKALQEKAKSMMAKHGGSSKRSGSSGKSKRRGSGELRVPPFAVLWCALHCLTDAAAEFSHTPVVA